MAADGPGPPAAGVSHPERPAKKGPGDWLEEAWRLRKAGDTRGAARAFEQARRAGADPQRIDVELGYLQLEAGNKTRAASRFRDAVDGPDPQLAAQSKAELRVLPARFWGDFYGEAVSWGRFFPATSADVVPTLRLRAMYRPSLSVDFNIYLFAQATRDAASHTNPDGAATVLADNYFLAGGGLMFRFWRNQLGLFAQAGPAVNLLDDGNPRLRLDVRGGFFASMASPRCFPTKEGEGAHGWFCGELYAEAVYVSRFDNNVIAVARPRLGVQALVTGPVAWQPMIEVRAAADVNGDFWNNFVEGGLVHRWRVLSKVPFDAILGVHAGAYYRHNDLNVPPSPSAYVEARLLLVTYLSTDAFR